jgi:hypothetical protein
MFRPLATRIQRKLSWLEGEDDEAATAAAIPSTTANLGLDLHVLIPR